MTSCTRLASSLTSASGLKEPVRMPSNSNSVSADANDSRLLPIVSAIATRSSDFAEVVTIRKYCSFLSCSSRFLQRAPSTDSVNIPDSAILSTASCSSQENGISRSSRSFNTSSFPNMLLFTLFQKQTDPETVRSRFLTHLSAQASNTGYDALRIAAIVSSRGSKPDSSRMATSERPSATDCLASLLTRA